ncbi:type II toxin-antitoxin system RelE/ParE family toxin [Mycobacterium sp. M1]|uniref:Type II toxin-antitoxin system RelE/ParE family toxin n=1 Tax=Mycolicibacter acidiphilus TaxID=2835306 RepID=A0ABS5RM11_9MYCO|nr:type II toxin-antitoxin system RelE/ParE family toxin [Mycolicibacter acidiphilus]MBS9533974.1 type II toxin-antitoxin system RelE/ParE family toxin [Mycolicibacter acidiphilus]
MTAHEGPYRIEVDGSARRDLERLPHKIAAAMVEFITGALADNPHRLSKPLRAELASYRSARRGDYRVVFRIDDARRVVLVGGIKHRAHAYRRRT